MKKTHTLSVAIPINNEAQNIRFLVQSILEQKQDGFVLEKIFVICDGTTDGTDKIVKKLAKEHSAIQLLNDHQRLGKPARVNEAFRMSASDLLLLLDGDVLLRDINVITHTVSYFADENVVLVGGDIQPVIPASFIGKLIYTWEQVWHEAKTSVNHGDHVYNVRGCVWAVRTSFSKNLSLPKGLLSSTHYVYFYAQKIGKKFAFAKDAVVLYRVPDNLSDYLATIYRDDANQTRELTKLFGYEVLEKYQVPLANKVRALLTIFTANPALTIMGIVFQIFVKLAPKPKKNPHKRGTWQPVLSTKKGIVKENAKPHRAPKR